MYTLCISHLCLLESEQILSVGSIFEKLEAGAVLVGLFHVLLGISYSLQYEKISCSHFI